MADNLPQHVSTKTLVELFGVTEQYVTQISRAGIIKRVSKGRFDLVASVQGYVRRLRETVNRRGAEVGREAAENRARLAKEQADAIALKNAAMRGEMVEAAAVERAWSDILRGVRAGMLAVPSRVAQRLPHLTVHDVTEIDAEIRAALTEIGNDRRG